MAPKKKSKSQKHPRIFFSYTEEHLQQAIKAVQENGSSKKKAAKQFGVPRSTLVRKLSGNVSLERKMGPSTELSKMEEEVLVKWILAMARKGFPVHKRNLLITVQKLVRDSEKPKRFFSDNGLPGRSWFKCFLRRHPSIKQKHAESVSKARAAVTRDRLENWFDEILNYLKEGKLDSILEDPGRIFNGDEAGFKLCPTSGKVLGPAKNAEDFYERVSSEKEQITVMAAFSASGTTVPPMLIFPYKKMPKKIVESVPDTWGLGRSESGWMNSEVFYEFISNHFLPYLKNEKIVRPVIFFVDGLKSHLTKYVSELCDQNGIILISLFPNATHILQPADVSVFKPLKSGWTSAVRNWKFENFPKEVTRFTFGTILSGVFEEYATKKTIVNGFRRCGLYPFNKDNVDYSKCIPNRNAQVQNDADTVQIVDNLNSIALSKIEENVPKDQIILFLDTYSKGKKWTGNIESFNLYRVWAAIKNKSQKINDTPANNPPESKVAQSKDQSLGEFGEVIVPQRNDLLANSNEIESQHLNLDIIFDPTSTDRVEEFLTPHSNDFSADSLTEHIESQNPDNHFAETLKDVPAQENATSYISPEPHTSRVWSTPENAKVVRYENMISEGFKVPTPFKKCLIFPKTPEKRTPKRKLTIFPAVVSSKKYREYYEQVEKVRATPKSKKKIELQPEPEKEGTSKKSNNIKIPQTKSVEIVIPKSKKKKIVPVFSVENDNSTSESDVDINYDDEDLDLSEAENLDVTVGNYVVVRYEGEYYPGK